MGREGGKPLCFLHLLDDGKFNKVWLQNYSLSDERFFRIAEIFSDSTYLAQVNDFEILKNGRQKPCTMDISLSNSHGNFLVGNRISDVEKLKSDLLLAIKRSRL